MRAIHRKLLRDVWRARAQVVSIAAVVAGGVMSVVMLRGTATALDRARAVYYAEARFADVFATLTRAPDGTAARLAAVPGVGAVSTRVVTDVRLDVPGLALPAVGRLISLPHGNDRAGAPLNVVRVLRGRAVDPDADDEVLVNGRFAEVNRLGPGDTLVAVVNERRVTLRVVGIGAAPDYLFEEGAGGQFTAEGTFCILWVPHELAASASGLRGAFNDVAIALTPGARAPEVIAAVDSVLAPFGGRGAVLRADQMSHRIVSQEMQQLATMAVAFPGIFVVVAAFLVGTVLARLVATEREQIAALKAFGYSTVDVGLHYLGFAATAVALGVALGIALGAWMGRLFTGLYVEILRIPGLEFGMDWATVVVGVGTLALAALLGAIGAVRGAALLPPAQALRPPAPARYRALLLDQLGFGETLSAAPRMVFRSLERRPSRSALGAVGVAAALALVAAALSLFDASDRMMEVQFRIGHRESLAVQLIGSNPPSVREAFARLPGVTRVELVRSVPVRVRHAGRQRTLAITGLENGAMLHRLVDAQGETHPLPPDGLVLSATLAPTLGLRAGDTVEVDLLERGTTRRAVVAALLDELMSPNGYADVQALGRLTGEGEIVTGAYLRLDGPPRPELFAALRAMPRVIGIASREAMLEYYDRMMARNIRVSATIVVAFAAVIALGVVYNGARISLSERGRELASLRVLGFTTREVGAMLLGEQAVLTLLALPLGWGFGRLLAAYLTSAFESELYQVPLVTHPWTYALASGVVLAASVAAGALMYRRTAHLDLVAVLKTRE